MEKNEKIVNLIMKIIRMINIIAKTTKISSIEMQISENKKWNEIFVEFSGD